MKLKTIGNFCFIIFQIGILLFNIVGMVGILIIGIISLVYIIQNINPMESLMGMLILTIITITSWSAFLLYCKMIKENCEEVKELWQQYVVGH